MAWDGVGPAGTRGDHLGLAETTRTQLMSPAATPTRPFRYGMVSVSPPRGVQPPFGSTTRCTWVSLSRRSFVGESFNRFNRFKKEFLGASLALVRSLASIPERLGFDSP